MRRMICEAWDEMGADGDGADGEWHGRKGHGFSRAVKIQKNLGFSP